MFPPDPQYRPYDHGTNNTESRTGGSANASSRRPLISDWKETLEILKAITTAMECQQAVPKELSEAARQAYETVNDAQRKGLGDVDNILGKEVFRMIELLEWEGKLGSLACGWTRNKAKSIQDMYSVLVTTVGKIE
jgi:hypothetical protein